MFENKECFVKNNMLHGIDYVFHTASPMFSSPAMRDNEGNIRKYIEAT